MKKRKSIIKVHIDVVSQAPRNTTLAIKKVINDIEKECGTSHTLKFEVNITL